MTTAEAELAILHARLEDKKQLLDSYLAMEDGGSGFHQARIISLQESICSIEQRIGAIRGE